VLANATCSAVPVRPLPLAVGAVVIRGVLEGSKTKVVIRVEDDGPGLPAEALDRVFKIGETFR
jgi:signal transduction histidine kinase